MLVKKVVCEVLVCHKDAFHLAQQEWKELASVPGLIMQMGGWSMNDPENAVILSIWRDQDSYDTFMNKVHDDITAKNNQADTYENISVDFFEITSLPEELYVAKLVAIKTLKESELELIVQSGYECNQGEVIKVVPEWSVKGGG